MKFIKLFQNYQKTFHPKPLQGETPEEYFFYTRVIKSSRLGFHCRGNKFVRSLTNVQNSVSYFNKF